MLPKLQLSPTKKDDESPELSKNWTLVQLFNLYRLCLAFILVGVYFFYREELRSTPLIYISILVIYMLCSVIAIFCTHKRFFDFEHQTIAQVFLDIFVLFLLLKTHPNMIYFYGILINAAIAAGSIIVAGRISLLFAAMASISVLLQYALQDSKIVSKNMTYTSIGVLAATFFVTAILAYALSRRIRTSEALARQRGVDLAKLSKLNAAIIERINSGIVVVDETDRIHFTNDVAKQLLGFNKQYVYLNDLSTELHHRLKEWRLQHHTHSTLFDLKYHKKMLVVRFVALGDPIEKQYAVLIFLEDGARLAQEAQQMKLASLGRLTASIAHEIRNPLGAISHAGQLLQESNNLSKENCRLSEIICEQSVRMNHVIENVLQLSRHKPLSPSIIPIESWLKTFIRQYEIEKQVTLELTTSVNDANILIEQTQLRQILTNLLDNAVRYTQKNNSPFNVDVVLTRDHNTNKAAIDVIDHGAGIDPSTAEHVFEPFFTTEETGTGLGLYIAKELCEANHAVLSYQSCTGGGTCFRIVFYGEG